MNESVTRLSREQVRWIDMEAVERHKIPGIVLMENASRAVADVATEMLVHLNGKSIIIVCGGGNNGGDGLAAARHLHNRGALVHVVVTSDPAKYSGEALTNWQIIQTMRIPILEKVSLRRPDLVLDAIFGTGLSKPPRESFEEIVESMQTLAAPILAVDIPSGLDCDSGYVLGQSAVRAARTVTFVAEKLGFANPSANEYIGTITVADIGCPRELIAESLQQRKDTTA